MKLTLTDILLKVYKANKEKLPNNILKISVNNTFKNDFKPYDGCENLNDAINQTLQFAELFYLDYVNNYTHVENMADDYSLKHEDAIKYYELGKLYNNNI